MKRVLSFLFLLFFIGTYAQKNQKEPTVVSDSLMLTVVLKHQQDKSLDSIQAIQFRNKFFELFPPRDIKIVSWNVAMGLGQIVTLKFPAHRLRDVNLSIEKGAWGAFDSEIYATYDFLPILSVLKKKEEEINSKK